MKTKNVIEQLKSGYQICFETLNGGGEEGL